MSSREHIVIPWVPRQAPQFGNANVGNEEEEHEEGGDDQDGGAN